MRLLYLKVVGVVYFLFSFLPSACLFSVFFYLFLLRVPVANAVEKTYGDVAIAMVGTIYDGDTFYVTVAGWPAIVGEHIAIRVKGVDTPEMRGKCSNEIQLARKAKQFTVGFLRSAKLIELKNMGRDKYFRIIADVYADGKSLSQALIKNGLGYEYYGEAKNTWCEKQHRKQ